MSSFGEHKAVKFATEDPRGFLECNKHHLRRTYPAGFRVDSSDYDPYHDDSLITKSHSVMIGIVDLSMTVIFNKRIG